MEKKQEQFSFITVKKVWHLLPDNKKPKAIVLVLMLIAGMVIEMLSVGLIFPALMILIDQGVTSNAPYLEYFAGGFDNTNDITVITAVILGVIIVYVLKNCYLALVAWKQSKFIFSTQADLAKSMLQRYITLPYAAHLERNSSDLINNLQVELNLFISYMLSPGLLFIAETLVVFGLVSILVVVEPFGTLSVLALFILAGGIFQVLTKKRVIIWGEKRREYEALRMKHAQEAFGAIKDIKLFGKEKFFLNSYESCTLDSLKMNQRSSFVHNLTRLWLEILSISGLCLLFLVMLYQGMSYSEILPTMGLFAAVSFRLLPSVSRIIASSHQLRFGSAVTALMEKELSRHIYGQTEKLSKMEFRERIDLKNVSFQYPSSERSTLKGVNLSIKKGKTIGFVGESGSGKSTLIDVILGLLEPSQGSIYLDGQELSSKQHDWQKLIGYVPQSIYLTDDTLKNNIAFGLSESEIDESAVNKAIKLAHIESLVEELPQGLDTMLGERGVRLSGGQLQRVGIARALYRDPEILILDEATSALDNETEDFVMDAIDELHGNKTILIIAHRVSTLTGCDHIYEIKSGGQLNERVTSL